MRAQEWNKSSFTHEGKKEGKARLWYSSAHIVFCRISKMLLVSVPEGKKASGKCVSPGRTSIG